MKKIAFFFILLLLAGAAGTATGQTRGGVAVQAGGAVAVRPGGGGEGAGADLALDLALIHAKIYASPSAPPLMNGVVLIHDGKISAVGDERTTRIPKGMRVMDCKGRVLTAGFWNSHLHFIEPKWQHADNLPASTLSVQLDDMINRYGFTHVYELATLDLKNVLALRARIESGEIAGPSILVAAPFVPSGGNPFYIRPLSLPEVSSRQEAIDYVNKQISSGADAIKLWSSSPTGNKIVNMPMEIARAAVEAAHRLGKPVFAHPSSDSGIVIAMESGVDVLAHTDPMGGVGWDAERVAKMKSHHMALIPTLKLMTWELARGNVPAADSGAIMATALQQLGTYARAGGEIVFGTDVGYVADYSPADEYALMGKAGMSFEDILRSLTTAPAGRFGKAGETGRIDVGSDADIVILATDPKKDVRLFADVAYCIRKGKFIHRPSLR